MDPYPLEGDLVHLAEETGCRQAVVTGLMDGSVTLAADGQAIPGRYRRSDSRRPGTWHPWHHPS